MVVDAVCLTQPDAWICTKSNAILYAEPGDDDKSCFAFVRGFNSVVK